MLHPTMRAISTIGTISTISTIGTIGTIGTLTPRHKPDSRGEANS